MKYRAIIISAAVILAASCAKEPEIIEAEPQFCGIIAQCEGTRTTLASDSKTVNWVSGDLVSINGVSYTAKPLASDPTKATFKRTNFSSEQDASKVDGKYKAYYPASIYNGGTPTLPATQTYSETCVVSAPMYAESTTDELIFNNLCGIIELKIFGAYKVRK